MSRNINIKNIMSQGMGLIEYYRQNPCIAAWELCRVDLAPIQRVVFEDMWFKDYIISVVSRGGGKTFLQGLLAVLHCLLYPGYRVGLIGPTFRQCFPIKSNTYDTFWTSDGLKTTAKELYDSIIVENTKTQSLYDSNKIVNKWLNDERYCIKIITDKGYEISGTTDHKVLVLSKDLSFVDKQLEDIDDKDHLVIRTGFNYFGNNDQLPEFDYDLDWRSNDCVIPRKLTPDLSYLFGLIVGDGCVSYKNKSRKYRIAFVNNDDELLENFKKHLCNYFGIDINNISEYERGNGIVYLEYFNKKLCEFLLKCGFTKTTSLDKRMPDVVKRSSKANFMGFLQGIFDTDGCCYVQNHSHGYPHCEVFLSTSSLQLAREVHSVLLNVGIISNMCVSNKAGKRCLNGRKKKSICAAGYKIRITGYSNLKKFSDIVDFRLIRKKNILDNYLKTCNLKVSNFTVPDKDGVLLEFIYKLKNKCERGTEANRFLGKLINRFKSTNIKNIRLDTVVKIVDLCEELNYKNNIYFNLKNILNNGCVFVSPVKFQYFKAPSIDIEVENEHCYWSNGFISHNSKMMFSEVEKLYAKSGIIRQACEKRPIRATDTCYLRFKAVGGYNGSYIESLPLGVDGAKIRGSRFYLICIDELAQVPDKVLDLVVRPFAAVSLEPMEKVRRLEQQRKLIEQGLAEEGDFEEETVNKMVMTSSGFFKFNHMWRRMKDHWAMMDKLGEESRHVVHQIPYWFLPKGFLEMDSIEEAKRTMSSYEFKMEYEAVMISDSEGFFKATLLEECTRDSGFDIELRGKKDGRYIIGIDPNQGGSASCGGVVIKLGEINKVVNVLELKNKTTQQLTGAIQDLCKIYNVIRIFMDQGGGGKAIMDLLDDGYNGHEPIIDRTDKDKVHKEGRHILEMVNFSPSWIADANFSTLALLEDKRLRFPEPPVSALEDSVGATYETITIMKSQMLSIIVTQTASGLLHFDTPKKGQNKDLYSAIILAASGVRQIEKELEEDDDPILHNTSGMIRYHTNKSGWSPFDGGDASSQVRKVGLTNPHLHAAVLKKKIK